MQNICKNYSWRFYSWEFRFLLVGSRCVSNRSSLYFHNATFGKNPEKFLKVTNWAIVNGTILANIKLFNTFMSQLCLGFDSKLKYSRKWRLCGGFVNLWKEQTRCCKIIKKKASKTTQKLVTLNDEANETSDQLETTALSVSASNTMKYSIPETRYRSLT